MNESSALNPAFTYTPSPAIQLAPGIPRLCLLCWKCKWPPWLFSFQWILSIVALVLTLTQGLYPLSQLPTPPPILMFYIAITLAFVSFLRSLRLRETLHCTDFSMQWCAYRYIGNKFKTKKVSKKKPRSHNAASWPQPCSPCRRTMHRMKLYMNASEKVERNCVY